MWQRCRPVDATVHRGAHVDDYPIVDEPLPQQTSDTSAIVPDSAVARQDVSDAKERLYYWSIDAKLLDGRAANTEMHPFRVR